MIHPSLIPSPSRCDRDSAPGRATRTDRRDIPSHRIHVDRHIDSLDCVYGSSEYNRSRDPVILRIRGGTRTPAQNRSHGTCCSLRMPAPIAVLIVRTIQHFDIATSTPFMHHGTRRGHPTDFYCCISQIPSKTLMGPGPSTPNPRILQAQALVSCAPLPYVHYTILYQS